MTQQKSLSPAYNKIQRRHGGSLSSAHSLSSSHSLKLPTITEVRANGHIHDRHLLKPDHSARSLALRYSRNSLSPLLSSHSSFSANYKGLNGRFLTKSQSKTADLLRIKSPDFNNISPRIDNRWSRSARSFSSSPNDNHQNDIIGIHKHKSYPVLDPIRSSLSNDYSNPAGTKTFVLDRKPVSIAHKNSMERSSSLYSLSPYRPYNDDGSIATIDRKETYDNLEKNKECGQDENADRVSLSTTLSFVQLWNEIKFILRKSAIQQTQNNNNDTATNHDKKDDKEGITETEIPNDIEVDKQIDNPDEDINNETSADGNSNEETITPEADEADETTDATTDNTGDHKSSETEIDEEKLQENQKDINESRQTKQFNLEKNQEIESNGDQENDTITNQTVNNTTGSMKGEFDSWEDDLQKDGEAEKYPHPIFVIEDSIDSSVVITEQPNSLSTLSPKKSVSIDPDLDTDLSLEMDSLASLSTMSLSPNKWSWRGEDLRAHYVNYPDDTRPSFKLPRRATSRKSTLVPIKLERMSLTCC